MAKRFFYVCAGLLCLALSYHFGARSATAQAPGNPVVAVASYGGALHAVTANGDVYLAPNPQDWGSWRLTSNVFAGGPTPTATPKSFGSLKVRYRGEREPQGVKPSTSR